MAVHYSSGMRMLCLLSILLNLLGQERRVVTRRPDDLRKFTCEAQMCMRC